MWSDTARHAAFARPTTSPVLPCLSLSLRGGVLSFRKLSSFFLLFYWKPPMLITCRAGVFSRLHADEPFRSPKSLKCGIEAAFDEQHGADWEGSWHWYVALLCDLIPVATFVSLGPCAAESGSLGRGGGRYSSMVSWMNTVRLLTSSFRPKKADYSALPGDAAKPRRQERTTITCGTKVMLAEKLPWKLSTDCEWNNSGPDHLFENALISTTSVHDPNHPMGSARSRQHRCGRTAQGRVVQ